VGDVELAAQAEDQEDRHGHDEHDEHLGRVGAHEIEAQAADEAGEEEEADADLEKAAVEPGGEKRDPGPGALQLRRARRPEDRRHRDEGDAQAEREAHRAGVEHRRRPRARAPAQDRRRGQAERQPVGDRLAGVEARHGDDVLQQDRDAVGAVGDAGRTPPPARQGRARRPG
jgi:hypothetical protein